MRTLALAVVRPVYQVTDVQRPSAPKVMAVEHHPLTTGCRFVRVDPTDSPPAGMLAQALWINRAANCSRTWFRHARTRRRRVVKFRTPRVAVPSSSTRSTVPDLTHRALRHTERTTGCHWTNRARPGRRGAEIDDMLIVPQGTLMMRCISVQLRTGLRRPRRRRRVAHWHPRPPYRPETGCCAVEGADVGEGCSLPLGDAGRGGDTVMWPAASSRGPLSSTACPRAKHLNAPLQSDVRQPVGRVLGWPPAGRERRGHRPNRPVPPRVHRQGDITSPPASRPPYSAHPR